jgi:dolichol kinase
MFAVCMVLGILMNGHVGYAAFVGGAFASVIEKFETVDDNISIPFGSALLMTLLRLL